MTILTIIGNGGNSATRELNNQMWRRMKKKLKWRGLFVNVYILENIIL